MFVDKMFFSSFTLMRISRGGDKLKFIFSGERVHIHKYLLLIKVGSNSLKRFYELFKLDLLFWYAYWLIILFLRN